MSLSNPLGNGKFAFDDVQSDSLNGAKFVRDLYEMANDTGKKYSVPVLWDTKLKTIVNNESSEIVQMLNSEFEDIATNKGIDLAPKALAEEI